MSGHEASLAVLWGWPFLAAFALVLALGPLALLAVAVVMSEAS
jgi:hypothetical protein